jgi:hypothetical protein
MKVRELRFLTVVIVALACGWTVAQGFGLVRYYASARAASDDAARRALQENWRGNTGVSTLALSAALRNAVNPADVNELNKRHDLLSALLAVKPTASQSWLALAAVRNSLGMPPAGVVEAFDMSALTGPNEGAMMFQRSLFGLLLWERLDTEAQARSVLDLCGLTVFDPGRFRLVLATKSVDVRGEIQNRLQSAGCPPRIVASVGL